MEIPKDHYDAPNLVAEKSRLTDCLSLGNCTGKYYPMYTGPKVGKLRMKGCSVIYQHTDPECDVLSEAMSLGLQRFAVPILNLANTPEDVRFRQEGVREMATDPEIYSTADKIIRTSFARESGLMNFRMPSSEFSDLELDVFMTPEKIKVLVGQLKRLGERASSESLRRCKDWAEAIEDDTLYQEQLREKRRITDSRIVAAFSERHKGVRYGILKPGIGFEDVFDVLSPEVSTHRTIKKGKRGGKDVVVKRGVVNFKFPYEEGVSEAFLVHGRQRMDILNQITSEMLAIPSYLALAQIQHMLMGAGLHQRMVQMGAKPSFPNITNNPSEIHATGLLPVRMVLESIRKSGDHISEDSLEGMCANDFHFEPGENIAQIEGANARGKSEAWRSMHLLINMANAGFSLPARTVAYGPVSASHFISCKGGEHHGGSEFQFSAQEILQRLQKIHPGQNVILDELGDSTNGQTGMLAAQRIVSFLTEKGCRVLVTTHNDSVGRHIESTGGTCYVTSSKKRGKGMYRLERKTGDAQYFPEKTLDNIWFTRKKMEFLFNNKPVVGNEISIPPLKESLTPQEESDEDDIPF
jgi:hypothetical protein